MAKLAINKGALKPDPDPDPDPDPNPKPEPKPKFVIHEGAEVDLATGLAFEETCYAQVKPFRVMMISVP